MEDAQESHTYYADANEAESWVREKLPLAKDDYYGKDEASARSLLNRCLDWIVDTDVRLPPTDGE